MKKKDNLSKSYIYQKHIPNSVKFKNNYKKLVIDLICSCLEQKKIFALTKKQRIFLKKKKIKTIQTGMANVKKQSVKKDKK